MGKNRTATRSRSHMNYYPAYCTECGEEIKEKNINIDKLLQDYMPPTDPAEEQGERLKELLRFLHISVTFGTLLLPEAPPFYEVQEVSSELSFHPYSQEEIKSVCSAGNNLPFGDYSEKRHDPKE